MYIDQDANDDEEPIWPATSTATCLACHGSYEVLASAYSDSWILRMSGYCS